MTGYTGCTNISVNNYNFSYTTNYTTASGYCSYSGRTYETEQEKAVRIRKERNKKLERIYGREPEKSNIPEMEINTG